MPGWTCIYSSATKHIDDEIGSKNETHDIRWSNGMEVLVTATPITRKPIYPKHMHVLRINMFRLSSLAMTWNDYQPITKFIKYKHSKNSNKHSGIWFSSWVGKENDLKIAWMHHYSTLKHTLLWTTHYQSPNVTNNSPEIEIFTIL